MKKFEQSMLPMFAGMQKKTVSIETITHSFNVIRIYLQDSINELDEHMDQIEAIRSASEDDIIEVYCISNRGGYVDTIVPLCNALATTPAHTVCFVEGHCGSAGTFPSMVCAEVHVGAYASFMLHCAQGGSGYGTMMNSAESARFFEKQCSDLLEDIYYGFITPEEARMLHDGRELYLNADDIRERLEKRKELILAEMKAETEEDCDCRECSVEEASSKEDTSVEEVKTLKKAPVKKTSPKKQK